MANKLTFDTTIFDNYIEKLEELGNSDLIKQAVDSGLKSAKAKVNEDIKKALVKPNMPRKGIYSTGKSKRAIDKDFKVKWNGTIAELPVGLSWDKLGKLASVLINGTPKQAPIMGLKEAIYGAKARRHVKKEVRQAIEKIIERTLNK